MTRGQTNSTGVEGLLDVKKARVGKTYTATTMRTEETFRVVDVEVSGRSFWNRCCGKKMIKLREKAESTSGSGRVWHPPDRIFYCDSCGQMYDNSFKFVAVC